MGSLDFPFFSLGGSDVGPMGQPFAVTKKLRDGTGKLRVGTKQVVILGIDRQRSQLQLALLVNLRNPIYQPSIRSWLVVLFRVGCANASRIFLGAKLVAFSSCFYTQTIVLLARLAPPNPTGRERLPNQKSAAANRLVSRRIKFFIISNCPNQAVSTNRLPNESSCLG